MAENNQKTITRERAERWIQAYRKNGYRAKTTSFWQDVVALCTGEKTPKDITDNFVKQIAGEILEKDSNDKIDPLEYYELTTTVKQLVSIVYDGDMK